MSHELHALRPLPAAPPLLGDLQAALADALAARGPTYVPRTQHKDGGTPHYVNRLILENSPYLLQHAHNPVNWYPWGAEAFEDARRLGRPVFLSIGYSTCHWCHVMEEESFEDEEIASVMNGGFICIKVDREERPDVDAIYMSAVQALTGSGGWPMSVWLNPDRQPFFGGTYFPPRDGARGARHGFLTLLRELARTYSEETERVVKAAHSLTTAVKQQMQAAVALAPTELSGAQWLDSTVERIKEAFDDVHGGTRRTPKFPSNLPVRLLLRQWRRTGDRAALQMATFTLEKMAAGGIYDQVGGGFHRYSTDERWLVPHFEKMLYDNALLAVAYAEAHQATGRADFARVLREILDYVLREMTSRQGGFYSATDADSEGEEGKFFVWSAAEVRELLGADAGRFMAHYDISAAGNFEGHNIPHVAHPDEGEWAGLADARRILYDVRALRPAPLRDEKILAAWNGLMISALAVGGRVLADARYVQAAGRAADFLLANMRQQDRLVRSYQENRRPAGSVQAGGFLEDQSFVAAGLLDLFEATFDARWLREALAVSEGLQRHFADGMTGGWFMTAHDAEPLIAREKPAYDGAEPSGTSVAILNAFRLGAFTSDDRWRQIGHSGLLSLSGLLAERGVALTEALLAVDFQLALPREVALIWPAGQADQGRVLIDVWRRSFSPGTVVAGGAEGPSLAVVAETVPFVRGKTALGGLPTAYVCHQGRCDLPTCDAEVLRGQLDQPRTAI